LRQTFLGSTGMRHLAEGIKDTDSPLYHLNVSKNEITAEGMSYLNEALMNTRIGELDLSENPIGNAGISHLHKSISKKGQTIEMLNISEC
jgi:heat shock protein HspQ